MANNYTLSSTFYPIENAQSKADRINEIIQKFALEREADIQGITDPDEIAEIEDASCGFEYDIQEDGIWMYHEESADVDAMAEVIAELQIETNATETFCFSYCCECSKPRVDEFGGGSFAITPDGQIFHAGSAEDAKEKAENSKYYANMRWSIEDVQSCADMSDEDAKAFLENNQKHIRERLTELGFEIIKDLLGETNLK